ncbi:MAG: HAMP domain-containing sensor histidine kinase [Pseudomonadota bacterium]
MTGTARHDEEGVPSRPHSSASPTPFAGNDVQLQKKKRPRSRPLTHISSRTMTSLTWATAAAASATALTIKLSQSWIATLDSAAFSKQLHIVFDWTVLILAIGAVCAVALTLFSAEPHTSEEKHPRLPAETEPTSAGALTNLRLPGPDDARLRLAQSISHELRTPLNAVIGFSSMMHSEAFGALGHPKYAEYCSHISDSSQTLLRTVEDLLVLNDDVSSTGLTCVPVPLVDVLESAWEDDAPTLFDAHASTPLDLTGETRLEAAADPALLQHAIRNLVATLKAHAKVGTPISVTLEQDTNCARLVFTAPIDAKACIDTAPLITSTSLSGQSVRASHDTLCETTARVLIETMRGRLEVREHANAAAAQEDALLEMICELPSPANDMTSGRSAA